MVDSPTIQMVDLKGQYRRLQTEIDRAVLDTIRSGAFINGPVVRDFSARLSAYTGAKYVIPCANGTDALQIALMSLDLKPGDEVIVPAFTYVATAEVVALLGLVPVMVDVDPDTFNLPVAGVQAALTPRTRAVVPVHLFGQSTGMEPLLALTRQHGIAVIEDNAQAIGARYTFTDGRVAQTGTMGDIGTTSFYPSKNLGAYGDGGAVFTDDERLAERLRSIANHGQAERRYYHDEVGVNSRLDAVQAAILAVKLGHLDEFVAARQRAAAHYDEALSTVEALTLPVRDSRSTHVFHQYTLRVADGRRDALAAYLRERGVPSMIYYPVPLYRQRAFAPYWDGQALPTTELLCREVLSLPMHTELDTAALEHITTTIRQFFTQAA